MGKVAPWPADTHRTKRNHDWGKLANQLLREDLQGERWKAGPWEENPRWQDMADDCQTSGRRPGHHQTGDGSR
jgi:hypothetical protein